jgi:mono/diheme cytochrome c family protein
MKTKSTLWLMLLAGTVILSAPLSAWAAHLGGTVAHPGGAGTPSTEDVRNTIHNLGDVILNFNNPNLVNTGAGKEVCVYCHTPHGANANAPGAAPLWNRSVPAGSSFTAYSGPNMDSTPLAPVGVSLACLSCHDGSLALDALINASGSGKFSGTLNVGARVNEVNAQGGSAFLDSGGRMSSGIRTDTGPNYGVITGGAAPFPNLTVNLGDDHPISMAMPPTTGANSDPQFVATRVQVGNLKILTRDYTYPDRRDAVRLYPAAGASTSGDSQWVECASCHNPHTPRPLFLRLPSPAGGVTVGDVTSATVIPTAWGGNGTLRWSDNPNQGSAVCLTCHEK